MAHHIFSQHKDVFMRWMIAVLSLAFCPSHSLSWALLILLTNFLYQPASSSSHLINSSSRLTVYTVFPIFFYSIDCSPFKWNLKRGLALHLSLCPSSLILPFLHHLLSSQLSASLSEKSNRLAAGGSKNKSDFKNRIASERSWKREKKRGTVHGYEKRTEEG